MQRNVIHNEKKSGLIEKFVSAFVHNLDNIPSFSLFFVDCIVEGLNQLISSMPYIKNNQESIYLNRKCALTTRTKRAYDN